MKTTIDIPDDIYRRVKSRSALEGRAVREVAITLFQSWVGQPDAPATTRDAAMVDAKPVAPPWFGSLRKYARNAGGKHDMASVRRSIARGRAREETPS